MKITPILLILTLAGPLNAGELDLSKTEIGGEPDGLFVVDGTFAVVENEDKTRALEIAPIPLAEAGTMFGETLKGGATITAAFQADRRGRSMPRFGIGMHGLSGYRLRLVPAEKKIELIYREERVTSLPFTWEPGSPFVLELEVVPTAEAEDAPWKASGRAWKKGQERPEKPSIEHTSEGRITGKGKASVWATPYAGLPIRISEITADAKE